MIYDGSTARPNALCGWIQSGCTDASGVHPALYDSIQWNFDGSKMYAANYESSGFDFYPIQVSSTGFGAAADFAGLVPGYFRDIHYDVVTDYVYDDDGSIIDSSTSTVVGNFNASGIMVPDGSLGTAFFLGQLQSNIGGSTYTLESFSMQTFTPIATLTIPNVSGTPSRLIRWGTSGLAFTTRTSGSGTSTVYLISGPFVDGTGTAGTPPTQNVH